ncbi:hypothetical protein L1887_38938 [Cichorium endivia]|nr:hypothetical protein L1887_38938 [Cichorium endivia]
MREAAKNGMRSGLVVIGAVAFGYLTLQLGFKPYLEKAQLHNSDIANDNDLNRQSDEQKQQQDEEHDQNPINDAAAIILDDGSPS